MSDDWEGNWSQNMETTFDGQCEGAQRMGGALSFGRPIWYRCLNPGTVMLKMKDGDPKPACQRCWEKCIKSGIKIESAEPVPQASDKRGEG